MENFLARIGFMAIVILVLFIIKKIDYYLYCKKTNKVGEDNSYDINIDEDD